MRLMRKALSGMAFIAAGSLVCSKYEMAFILATAAAQHPLNCYQIQNMDQRNLCLAQGSGQSSYCYQFQNMDMRSSCLAVVTGQRSYCYQIQAKDSRNSCLVMLNDSRR